MDFGVSNWILGNLCGKGVHFITYYSFSICFALALAADGATISVLPIVNIRGMMASAGVDSSDVMMVDGEKPGDQFTGEFKAMLGDQRGSW